MPQGVNIHPTLEQAAIQYQTSVDLLERTIGVWNARNPDDPIQPKTRQSDSASLWDYHDIEKAVRFLNEERDRMMAENNQVLREHNRILRGILRMLHEMRGDPVEIGERYGEGNLEWDSAGDTDSPSGGDIRALPEPDRD